MDEKYSISDFKNVVLLKNQLITLSLDELKEIYQDYDTYLVFLDTVAVMTNIDSGFLLLNEDFIFKIESLLHYHRFESDSDTWNMVNEAIQYFNLVKNYSSSYRQLLVDGYRSYQEDVRGRKVQDISELLRILSYDAYLIVAMEEEDMEIANDNDYFLSSLNYLIETCPELFEESKIQTIIQNRLKSVSYPRRTIFPSKEKKYLQFTKNHFQKIKQKGE